MTKFEEEEKRFTANTLIWSRDEERYEYGDEIIWDGKSLQFDTYKEFVAFMASLTEDEKRMLDIWQLNDNYTDESIMVSDGIYDDPSFISMRAEAEEAEAAQEKVKKEEA